VATLEGEVRLKQTQKLLWTLVALLAVTVAGIAWWKAGGVFRPKTAATATIPVCDLQVGPCTASLPDGRSASLALLPLPVVALKPITVHLKLSGIQAQRVVVDFTGVNMDMGFNRFPLKRAGVGYAGKAILPVCTRSRMEWKAEVLVQTEHGLLAFPFRFDTIRP